MSPPRNAPATLVPRLATLAPRMRGAGRRGRRSTSVSPEARDCMSSGSRDTGTGCRHDLHVTVRIELGAHIGSRSGRDVGAGACLDSQRPFVAARYFSSDRRVRLVHAPEKGRETCAELGEITCAVPQQLFEGCATPQEQSLKAWPVHSPTWEVVAAGSSRATFVRAFRRHRAYRRQSESSEPWDISPKWAPWRE